jgi:hypothetical protein
MPWSDKLFLNKINSNCWLAVIFAVKGAGKLELELDALLLKCCFA